MTIIKDGTGTGNNTKVSGNRLFAHTITESEAKHAAEKGEAYNINTGTIALTSSTSSGILYIKNNEDRDLIVEALAVGLGSAGTTTDVTTIEAIRNPTAGTLISDATAVDINQNRNFGSSKTLTSDAYKGAEGKTVTGGNAILQLFAGPGTRVFAPIELVLTKGDSIAIKADTNTSSGTTNIYAAVICYLKETDFKD